MGSPGSAPRSSWPAACTWCGGRRSRSSPRTRERRQRMNGRVAALLLGTLAGVSRAASPSLDWPQWRGPARTGVAAGPVAARWPAGSLARAWAVEVGEGHSGPVVSGSRVYVHARVGGDEVISALDLADGRRVWTHRQAVAYTPTAA